MVILPPGRYTVAFENAPFFLNSVTVEGAKVQGTTIEVRGAGSLRFAIVLSNGSSQVRGKVLSDGNPVAGALVLLVPEDFENHPQLFRRDESNSDGTFALPPVPPGRYVAIALLHGWDIEWARPEVLKPYLAKAKLVSLTAGVNADLILELQ